MRQRLVRNIELFVFGPTEMSLGFAHCFLTRRVAVRLARTRRRHAVSNCSLDGNQRRATRDRLCITNCGLESREIISVVDGRSVPAISFKSLRHSFRKSELGKASDGDVLVVVEINQLAKFQMAA